MSGLRRSNSGIMSETTSPSRPRPQKITCSRGSRARAVQDVNAKCKMQNAKTAVQFCILHFAFCISLTQPASGKSGTLQSLHDMRVLPHRPPHQSAPVILDHGHDRTFVDAEVVD